MSPRARTSHADRDAARHALLLVLAHVPVQASLGPHCHKAKFIRVIESESETINCGTKMLGGQKLEGKMVHKFTFEFMSKPTQHIGFKRPTKPPNEEAGQSPSSQRGTEITFPELFHE